MPKGIETGWKIVYNVPLTDKYCMEDEYEYCTDGTWQKAIDDFIETKELPKRVDDFFVKAIQALLKGFEPVVVNADDLVEKLTKLPPLDEQTFRSKVSELISGYTSGKDAGKLRIIVKK